MKQFLAILILLSGQLARGQSYSFKHLTMAEGLPGHRELQLCEDPYGRLWIGGIGGIGIFDGAQLETISQNDQWGMKGFQVNHIIRSRSGAMWVATNEQVQYLEKGKGRFEMMPQDNGSQLQDVLYLAETRHGDILAVTEQAVFRKKANKKTLIFDEGLTRLVMKQGKTMLIQWVKDDQWLMSSRQQTALVDIEKALVLKTYKTLYLWCAAKVDDNHMLVGSFGRDTVSMLNLETGEQDLLNSWPVDDGTAFGGYIGGMANLGNGKYALASRYYGVYIADVKNRRAGRWVHSAADPSSIINNFCRTAYVTQTGTLFISSSGLSYTQIKPPPFSSVKKFDLDNAETYDANIHSIYYSNKNTLWIGGNNGLMRWDPGRNKGYLFRVYAKGNNQTPPRTVRSIIADSLGRIWVGTYGAGIAMLKGENFVTYGIENTPALVNWPRNDTYALLPDGHGSFWVATDGGPAHFNPYTSKGTGFKQHPVMGVLNGQSCFYILPSAGSTWFAVSSGIYAYDSVRNQLDTVYRGLGRATPVHGLASDGKGLIYAACFDGLRIIDEKNRNITKHLSRKDGLFNEQLMGVRLDSLGNVWMIGLQGIAQYKPNDKKLRSFTVRDGVLTSDFRYNALYLSPEGKMYAGNDGYNVFNPHEVSPDTSALNVFITTIQSQDSVFNPGLPSITLKPHQRSLQFNFLAADLRLGPYIQYRYRLTNSDTGFIYAGKQRVARYNNIPPGQYAFVVEASADGIRWYASQPLMLTFKKALWENAWVRIGLLLLGIAAAFFFTRRHIKGIRKAADVKRQYENEIAEIRMNLLRAQMNPHFIFNSLNSINHFILSNDKLNASSYLTKFSRLMRLMLDNSRSEWVLLVNELKALELYIQLEAMRLNKSFSYNIQIGDGIDADSLIIPPLLLQPFIENAIWHGLMHRQDGDGKLDIDIRTSEDRLHILIRDNGIGRKAAELLQKHNKSGRKSHGIMITRERMYMINEIYKINAGVTIHDLQD
nr:histidine kinase [Chitinophagaceae bacterium]